MNLELIFSQYSLFTRFLNFLDHHEVYSLSFTNRKLHSLLFPIWKNYPVWYRYDSIFGFQNKKTDLSDYDCFHNFRYPFLNLNFSLHRNNDNLIFSISSLQKSFDIPFILSTSEFKVVNFTVAPKSFVTFTRNTPSFQKRKNHPLLFMLAIFHDYSIVVEFSNLINISSMVYVDETEENIVSKACKDLGGCEISIKHIRRLINDTFIGKFEPLINLSEFAYFVHYDRKTFKETIIEQYNAYECIKSFRLNFCAQKTTVIKDRYFVMFTYYKVICFQMSKSKLKLIFDYFTDDGYCMDTFVSLSNGICLFVIGNEVSPKLIVLEIFAKLKYVYCIPDNTSYFYLTDTPFYCTDRKKRELFVWLSNGTIEKITLNWIKL